MYSSQIISCACLPWIGFVLGTVQADHWARLDAPAMKESQRAHKDMMASEYGDFYSQLYKTHRPHDELYVYDPDHNEFDDRSYNTHSAHRDLFGTKVKNKRFVKRVLSPKKVKNFVEGAGFAAQEAQERLQHFEKIYGKNPKPKGTSDEKRTLLKMLTHEATDPETSLAEIQNGVRDKSKDVEELRAVGRNKDAERCQKALDEWTQAEELLHSRISVVTNQIEDKSPESRKGRKALGRKRPSRVSEGRGRSGSKRGSLGRLAKRVLSPQEVEHRMELANEAAEEIREAQERFDLIYGRRPRPKGLTAENEILANFISQNKVDPKENIQRLREGAKEYVDKEVAELKAVGRGKEAKRYKKAINRWMKAEERIHSKVLKVTNKMSGQSEESSARGTQGGGGAKDLVKGIFSKTKSEGKGSGDKKKGGESSSKPEDGGSITKHSGGSRTSQGDSHLFDLSKSDY